jgi:uncharacterized protein involved in high-affinity Fe2+ transport
MKGSWVVSSFIQSNEALTHLIPSLKRHKNFFKKDLTNYFDSDIHYQSRGPATEQKLDGYLVVYLHAVDVEPGEELEGMLPRDKSDIHLEGFINATEGNPNGFGAGEWIPELTRLHTHKARQ